jgi:hypothetical protein
VLEKLPIELGHALKGQRAGVQNITFYRLLAARTVPRIGVHSNAFGNMEPIPTRYTADGDGASPPIGSDDDLPTDVDLASTQC